MDPIASFDIQERIERDNPWWTKPEQIIREAELARRVYFRPFKTLALNFAIKRATVLMGPRRVGKTVMVRQLIHEAMLGGIDAKSILYASIDAPVYSGTPLERFLSFIPKEAKGQQRVVIFDEIQYLRDWEIHLKDLVDNYPDIKFIATGSAAAALRLKSRESGAGRFSEFMLPPLTFYEFLDFTGKDASLIEQIESAAFRARNIDELNNSFIDYLNHGGYPEAVTNPQIQQNADQFIRNDIIDKVLLKDLPSLYGIHEIQELNKLFSVLAYNAGAEASFENIAQTSGITKPTIRRYIEYLESAFLVMKLSTVNDDCRTMTRERNFKIYLNNPSMRAALFAPVKPDDSERIGYLAECAIFSQWQHSSHFRQLRYARWRNEGEVDVVYLSGAKQAPLWIGEIKWSDRIKNQFGEQTKSMQTLLRNHSGIQNGFFTTKTFTGSFDLDGRKITVRPTALHCYTVGRNITAQLDQLIDLPGSPE
ncbi:ATP-binding protein [Ferrovibrio sp.]|uniref:ATP-binding protein n=1 Tax=Ferrovibrio sp. TaxID=1917215 RepID=UPI0035AEA198